MKRLVSAITASPTVSVIVPTYNRARIVVAAIDSILDQTFKDFELIVVDNCSSDNTEEVVRSYKDERIRYFKNQNNGVVAVNRNYGISQAQGDYVAFCDDDDVWYPEKLAKCLEVFRQTSGVILVCHDENIVSDGRRIRVHVSGPYREPMYESLLFKGNCLSPSAVVVKRDSLLSSGGFDENPDFTTVEDWDLWMRLTSAGKFHFLHEILGEYRIHNEMFSYNVERRVRHCLNLVEHHFSKLSPDELRRHATDIRKVKAGVLSSGGWDNLRRKNFTEARQWFRQSIQAYPFDSKHYVGFVLASLRVFPRSQ